MDIISKENVAELIKGSKDVAKFAVGAADTLTTEAINLFIVDSALSILKFGVVFAIFFIVKKYLDTMMKESDKKEYKVFKSLKTTALVLSLVFFTTQSFPHIQSIAKALVAPKIFLLEKANIIK